MLDHAGVSDPNEPPWQRAVEELEKPEVRRKLFKLARWRTGSESDAQDLVQEALKKVCEPGASPWNPAGDKSFVMHVGSVINGLASNQSRSARALHEIVDATLVRDDALVDGGLLADESLAAHREFAELRRLGERLLAELEASDPDAADVYRLAMQGYESAAEQAAKLERAEDDVRNALLRIKYGAAQIAEQERKAALRQSRERRDRGGSAGTIEVSK